MGIGQQTGMKEAGKLWGHLGKARPALARGAEPSRGQGGQSPQNILAFCG